MASLLLVFAMMLMMMSSGEMAEREFAVVAYLPEWRFMSANYDVICRLTSHLIMFSVEVGVPGEAAIVQKERLAPEALAAARAAAQKHGTKLLVCFGGNGRTGGFAKMAQKKKLRAGFIRALASFLEVQGFDGVDYNWEYPGATPGAGYADDDKVEREYADLAKLVEETRTALGPEKVITMAYYPDGRQEELLVKCVPHVDFLHSMAYDQPTKEHSSVAFAESALKKAKPYFQRKQTLGLPFYGRDMKGHWTTYEDLLKQISPFDANLDVVEDTYFNGVETIKRKVKRAIDSGIAGVMIWEVGQDCRLEPVSLAIGQLHVVTCPTPQASLLRAIHDAIRETNGVTLMGKNTSSLEERRQNTQNINTPDDNNKEEL